MKLLKKIFILLGAITLSIIIALGINEKLNETVVLTEYTFKHSEIPKAFNGYKIMVISDLHEAPFAEQIVEHIRRTSPDIIAFTGDMVQLPGDTVDETIKIANEINDIPIYAISGNHDRQCGAYDKIIKELRSANVIPLDNDSVCIEKESDSFLLLGVKDPRSNVVSDEKIKKCVNKLKVNFPTDRVFPSC